MKRSGLFIATVFFILAACSNKQPFNRALWNEGDGIEFKYRKAMLDDLLKNHNLKGRTWKQVRDTLGRPQGTKGRSIYYDIDIKYDGYPPSYVKKLYIDFNADSVAVNMRVYEHAEKKK